MGEPKTVPAGQYAEEVLNKLNILEKIKTKAIYGKDVKEVLTWVETGNVDAGIVYETDARASHKVKMVAAAPEGSHKPIVYPASSIKIKQKYRSCKSIFKFFREKKEKQCLKNMVLNS